MAATTARRENRISPVSNLMLNLAFVLLSLACVLPVVLVSIVSFTNG